MLFANDEVPEEARAGRAARDSCPRCASPIHDRARRRRACSRRVRPGARPSPAPVRSPTAATFASCSARSAPSASPRRAISSSPRSGPPTTPTSCDRHHAVTSARHRRQRRRTWMTRRTTLDDEEITSTGTGTVLSVTDDAYWGDDTDYDRRRRGRHRRRRRTLTTPSTQTQTTPTRTLLSSIALDRALAPVESESFLAEHWERKPLVVPRGEEGHFDDLLSVRDVERLITETGIRTPAFRLVKAGATYLGLHDRPVLAAGRPSPASLTCAASSRSSGGRHDRPSGPPLQLAAHARYCRGLEAFSATPPRRTPTTRRASRRVCRPPRHARGVLLQVAGRSAGSCTRRCWSCR